MQNIALVIEYNGFGFSGWQIQPGVRTVQGELIKILSLVTRQSIPALLAAGRTDAGVHAMGQVVNFRLNRMVDLGVIQRSVSAMLKGEVSVVRAFPVADEFHAQYDAVGKQYRYLIYRSTAAPALDYGKVWHIPRTFSLQVIIDELNSLVGSHDFTAFRGRDCNATSPIRTVSRICVKELSEHYIQIEIEGNGFLKRMVRNIVGAVISRAYGKCPPLKEILLSKNRRSYGPGAPAHGLYLQWVRYPEKFPKGLALVPVRQDRNY